MPISSYAEDEWKVYNLNATILNFGNLNKVEFKIPYKIINGTLGPINYDTYSDSLLVHLNNTNNGILEIKIPKDLINALTVNGVDDKFFILINGVATNYYEDGNTNCFRNLSIKFSPDSKLVEIPVGGLPSGPVRSYVPPVYLTVNKTMADSQQLITTSGCTDLKLDDKQVILNITNTQTLKHKTISIIPDISGSFSASVPVQDLGVNGNDIVNATYAGHTTTGTVTVPEFPYGGVIFFAIASLLVAVRLLPSKLKS